MKRITAAAAFVAVLTLAGAALAITYGTEDGNRHPNVGALLAPTQYSDGTWVTCTGTLIAPTLFFDTGYHLTQAGGALRTDKLAGSLRAILPPPATAK